MVMFSSNETLGDIFYKSTMGGRLKHDIFDSPLRFCFSDLRYYHGDGDYDEL